ncbi:MAG: 4Fe-4S ferredoxin iron-sulfur binding domain protein [Deltaproteobacteria bacterium]|nr:4Fe-4S ferredoxin iron-sulfur binding domain protein [Deltaproteobacteria bacterium]
MKGFSYLRDVVTLELDRELCIGCGLCAEVCPQQLFAMQGGKAQIMEKDACMECGACALNCPVTAIAVDAGVGCASGMINEWLASLKLGGGSDSSCC